MTDWKSCLVAVDSQPQSEDVIEAVLDAFEAAKIKDPSSALGLTADDVKAHLPQGNTAALALLRRAFVALDHAAAVQRAQELRAASAPLLPGLVPSALALSGTSTASALALAGGSPQQPRVEVDVYSLLKAVNLDKLPTDAIPELAVFEDMARETKALAGGKKTFTFVDLTHRDLAPLWLTPAWNLSWTVALPRQTCSSFRKPYERQLLAPGSSGRSRSGYPVSCVTRLRRLQVISLPGPR